MASLDDVVAGWARRTPDAPALVWEGRATSFAALDRAAWSWARALAEVAAPGDRVVVAAPNHPAWVGLYYGAPRAGLVLAMANHRLGPGPLRAALDGARAAVAVVGTDQLAALDQAGLARDLAPTVVPLHPLDPLDPLHLGPVAGPEAGGRGPGGTAWLVPTSGTTGAPKWVELTHANLLAAVATTSAARPHAPDGTYLLPFPLCHVAGYNVVLAHARGLAVALLHRFDPAAFVAEVAAHRVATASLAPTMVHDLVDHLDRHPAGRAALAPLRALAYGSAPMAPELLARAQAALDVDLHQGYGMTELAGNAVFLSPADHRRALAGAPHLLAAAGRPGPGVEVRVVDDGGRPLAPGQEGEIAVRGAQVMAGYWEAPEATAEAVVDGWLRTGDVGRWDGEGYLYVVDRKRDVIVSGGENVPSRLVEEALATHPGVAEVAVVGAPDPRWGEVVCAVVVPRPGWGLTEADVLAHGRAAIGGYQQPRRVVLVDRLPRNATGKVVKAELRAALAATPG